MKLAWKFVWGELIVQVATSLLALLGAVFGAFDPLWRITNLNESDWSAATLTLAIVVILIGHFLGSALRERKQLDDIDASIDRLRSAMDSSLSGHLGLRVFQTSDDAIEQICNLLPRAQKVWNTRIPAPGLGQYQNASHDSYSKNVEQCLRKGTYFREVVGTLFVEHSDQLRSIRGPGRKAAKYDRVVWEDPNTPFFNFIVLQLNNGEKVVIFGWVITPVRGFEQECFMSKNASLIECFVSIHDYMMANPPTR